MTCQKLMFIVSLLISNLLMGGSVEIEEIKSLAEKNTKQRIKAMQAYQKDDTEDGLPTFLRAYVDTFPIDKRKILEEYLTTMFETTF